MTTKQLILDKTEEAFKKAEAYYGKPFSRPLNIIFKRNGTTAGYCNYRKKTLMFQLDLAEHNEEDFISQTVPHEVAHWIDFEHNGIHRDRKGWIAHGYTWKYIMRRVYGLNPDRCHTYDVSVTITKKQAKHEYTCGCTTHRVSTTLHNKMMRGEWRKCRRCNQRLSFKGGNPIPPINPITIREQEIAALKAQIARLQNI